MNGLEGDAMTVEEMKQRKKELGYSNEKLSELSGEIGRAHV